MVERCFILPPQSHMGPAAQDTRNSLIEQSPFNVKYRDTIDRESAYENLQQQAEAKAAQEAAPAEAEKKPAREAAPRHQKSSFEKAADSALSTIGREVGKSLVRGLFDVLKR